MILKLKFREEKIEKRRKYMKKLLLFIVILFGILSVQSLADAMCGSNGEYNPNDGKCWPIQKNDGYVSQPKKEIYIYPYASIYYSSKTGVFGYSWLGYKSGVEKAAKESCGDNSCKKIATDAACYIFAKASNNSYGGERYAYYGYNEVELKKSRDKALKNCEKSGGKDCKIELELCSSGTLHEHFDNYDY